MEDIKYIQNVFQTQTNDLVDTYGFEYKFLVEVVNNGDHLDVNIGEFDDLNVSALFETVKQLELKDDFFINSVSISVKHKQIKIEVKKGVNESKIKWKWPSHDQEEYISKIDYETIRKFINIFSQSERVEAYSIYYNLIHNIDAAYVREITSLPKPESIMIKLYLQSDSIIESNIISYVGCKFNKCSLFTDEMPHIVCHFERKNKDFV